MLWITVAICAIILFRIKPKTYPKISNFKADIVLSPGGYYGMYTLGVCHFIKNHFDIHDKTKLGFSSGSFNALFLTLDTKKDNEFISKLFQTKINHNEALHRLTDKVTSCVLDNYSIEDFDISTLNVGLTHPREMGVYNNFLTLDEVVRCCVGSSFVPFVTYKDLIYIYKQKLTLDGGFLYRSYLKGIDPSETLIIRPSMFNRYEKTRILGRGLMRQNNSFYGLYIQGYRDACDNIAYLDKYLKRLETKKNIK
jgi:hypothetical protein